MSWEKNEGPFRIPLPPVPGESEPRVILMALPKRLLQSDRAWLDKFLDALYWDSDPAERPAPTALDPLTGEPTPPEEKQGGGG